MDPSLIKAMGGPSSGKAGVSRDPEETNRIIAEASKNSKYFQEVKRRDQQLRERINKLLKERDDVMKAADLAQAELHSDQVITELEATRDLSKVICHVDLDAFYASVEALDDPSLTGKAFGVGHGVLTTASYEARKFGVRSGMATFIARKLCPHLIIVSNHFHRYMEKSKQVMEVLRKYDESVCVMGADEAYLTLNDYCDTHQLTPEECVKKMRAEVFETSQLTCSAGIAPNRRLAKICSDRNKPNGQFELAWDPETIIAFMKELPIRKIPGIGRVSERVLTEMGIDTCGDVYEHRGMISSMDKQLGLRGLLGVYLGLGSNVVEPPSREGRKSVGAERTFQPTSDKAKLMEKLEHVAEELEEDAAHGGWAGRTITLKYKLDTHQTFTRAKSLPWYITSKEDILAAGRELLVKELPLKLRLIGLRLTSLKDLRPPANGIEKFFESAAEKSKKRKQQPEEQTMELVADEYLLDGGEHPESEVEDDRAQWGVEDTMGVAPSPSKVRPLPMKPPSSRTTPSSATSGSVQDCGELQTCPICSKRLRVDNAGLNEHIDYCLSKGTIMEATTDIHLPATTTEIERSPNEGKGVKKLGHCLDDVDTEDGARGLKGPKVVK